MNQVWLNENIELSVIFLSFPFFYMIHHYELLYKILERITGMNLKQPFNIYFSRICSTLVLGIFPYILVFLILNRKAKNYGFFPPSNNLTYILIIILCLLIFPLLLVYSKTKEAGEYIPLAQPDEWNILNLILNILSWFIYLTAYEFYFRGLIIFSLSRAAGTLPAIAIMTSLYTFVHLSRGKVKAWGSLIMGFLSGFLALYSGSFFPSLVIHFFISITMDILMITRYRTR